MKNAIQYLMGHFRETLDGPSSISESTQNFTMKIFNSQKKKMEFQIETKKLSKHNI